VRLHAKAGYPGSSSLDFAAVALLAAAGLCGCMEVELRSAMSKVQLRYLRLTEAFETGSNFGARDAASELRKALQAPEISRTSPYAKDEEYQRLLREAVEETERIGAAAKRFDREALGKMQVEISARCDACHKRFRTP
jgi:cytochrome c556